MIDLANEQLITLSQAARVLPGHPSIATLWRWRTRGVNGRYLESVVLGGKVYTSLEAIDRFADQRGGRETPVVRTTRQRRRAIADAEQKLREAGI